MLGKKFILKNIVKSDPDNIGKHTTTLYYDVYQTIGDTDLCIKNYPIEFYDQDNLSMLTSGDREYIKDNLIGIIQDAQYKEYSKLDEMFKDLTNGQ